MPTYAIGDVQGCNATLQRLLRRVQFNPDDDVVWLAGDLVNRGPDSLGVLRWAASMGPRVVAVLGNHDLSLLSTSYGVRDMRPSDTLAPVLAAPDRDALLAWLRMRPLVHRQGKYLMVHAGVLPSWSADDAVRYADEVHAVLRGPHAEAYFRMMPQHNPSAWQAGFTGDLRLAAITKVLTYMRVSNADDGLHLDFTGTPDDAPAGFAPWFAVTPRRTHDVTIVCGHWSALGLHREHGILALDTGCVWGQTLTAVRLEDGKLFQEPSAE